jgi:hypothetical protein
MQKYPLIGVSIVAVVLLILGSLTNVVGYQTVKSSEVNDSPLFKTRTQRATNRQQNILTSQYLGKEKVGLLHFPTTDNTTELLNKVIESIGKMDDKTYQQLTELCIKKVKQDKTMRGTNQSDIIRMLQDLRIRPKEFKNNFADRNNCSIVPYPTIGAWLPGCLLLTVEIIIITIVGYILLFIADFFSLSCTVACKNFN